MYIYLFIYTFQDLQNYHFFIDNLSNLLHVYNNNKNVNNVLSHTTIHHSNFCAYNRQRKRGRIVVKVVNVIKMLRWRRDRAVSVSHNSLLKIISKLTIPRRVFALHYTIEREGLVYLS